MRAGAVVVRPALRMPGQAPAAAPAGADPDPGRRRPVAAVPTGAVLGLTIVRPAVGTLVRDLPQFAGTASGAQFEGTTFGARLVGPRLLARIVPVLRSTTACRRPALDGRRPVPWPAFGRILLPLLVDPTGGTLEVDDRPSRRDAVDLLANRYRPALGLGLLMARRPVPPPREQAGGRPVVRHGTRPGSAGGRE